MQHLYVTTLHMQQRLFELAQLLSGIEYRLTSVEQHSFSHNRLVPLDSSRRTTPQSVKQLEEHDLKQQVFSLLYETVHARNVAESHPKQLWCKPCKQDVASGTETRLAKELFHRGIKSYRFQRVPEHYYEEDLGFRRSCLQAESIQHLCKSLLYENPKLPSEQEFQQFRYYLVIVQVSVQAPSSLIDQAN